MKDRPFVRLGTRLREERDRLQLTQDELADRLGVSSGAQSNYERGNRSPDAEYLAAFVAAGADPLYLLQGVRTEAKPSGAAAAQRGAVRETSLLLEQLGQLLRQVPEDQREAAAVALSGWAKAGGAEIWRHMFAAAINSSEKQQRTGT